MIHSLIQIANGSYSEAKKNLSVELSFDLNMIYKQSLRQHQNSRLFKDPYMTKIKTSFFGLYDQLYKKPTQSLMLKNNKSLTSIEKNNLNSGSLNFSTLTKEFCSLEDKKLLGCKDYYFVVDTILSPEVACKQQNLKSAFKAKFYLSHSAKYGFKISDIEFAGTRIILETFRYTDELIKKGYKKEAILARFQNLQNTSSSFKFPKRLNHSRSIMAIIESNQNRAPTSL